MGWTWQNMGGVPGTDIICSFGRHFDGIQNVHHAREGAAALVRMIEQGSSRLGCGPTVVPVNGRVRRYVIACCEGPGVPSNSVAGMLPDSLQTC